MAFPVKALRLVWHPAGFLLQQALEQRLTPPL